MRRLLFIAIVAASTSLHAQTATPSEKLALSLAPQKPLTFASARTPLLQLAPPAKGPVALAARNGTPRLAENRTCYAMRSYQVSETPATLPKLVVYTTCEPASSYTMHGAAAVKLQPISNP